MTIRSRRLKRKLHPEPAPNISKKLRSKIPRRRRCRISPVLIASTKRKISGENLRFMVVSVDSSSCCDFAGEVSCNSSRASAVFDSKGRSKSKQRLTGENQGVQNGECADIWIKQTSEKQNESEVEVSESSCVDSCPGVHEQRSLILKFRSGKESKNLKENNEVYEACTRSEITCEEQLSCKNSKSGAGNLKISSERNGNDVVSVSSGVRATFEELGEEKTRGKENRASEFELNEASRNHHADENCANFIAQSTVKQWSNNSGVDSDLACTEDFSYDEYHSEYTSSQETAFSDLHSEIFTECSELEISDYSPSLFIDSGSQFSQGSVGETPSPTYSLFLQYSKEFSTLTTPVIASCVEDENSVQLEFLRFEDLDDEDSYQMLRKRERRQVLMCNYARSYCSTTGYGELVLQQRSQMVHWIVEQSNLKQLRQETMFLGVSLLDRFLSKGYFKSKRNLQLVGIACLMLATRIEENQNYNRVGQKNFYIESSTYGFGEKKSSSYGRCEVVGMEWMVLEVLKFQCYLPTFYNFLWFYLKAAKADADIEKRVKYLAVLALSAHEQLRYWPSTVAAALVILACLEVNQNASHKVIGMHVRSKDENLHECIESLEWLLHYSWHGAHWQFGCDCCYPSEDQ